MRRPAAQHAHALAPPHFPCATPADVEGNEYFDCLQCAGTLALGHNHPVAVEAAKSFLDSGSPMQVLDLNSPYKNAFMKELLGLLPDNLTRLHFASPAGTDCLDAAVKLCKVATGRRAVVSFHGGYHGMGQSTMAMMGNLNTKSNVPGLMGDTYFLPFPYQYRQPFGIKDPEEADAAVMAYIETALRDDESGIPKPACVVVEAIQGEGGVQPMSPWAMRELRRITKEQDIPLVIDEVQAGFCRSGRVFAFQHSDEGPEVSAPIASDAKYGGIKPDVVCMSKAVGGGMPQAVVAFSEELNKWAPAAHTGTFRGNQISFATGTATLQYMQEHKLWEKAERQGEWLQKRLNELAEETGIIGDVRGRGLMVGAELVRKDATDHNGVPMPDGEAAAAVQAHAFKEKKLIIEKGGRHGGVLRFLPPLTVTDEELERCVDMFSDSVRAVAASR